jgi:hypothetical protein
VRLVVAFAGLVALMVATIGTYYVISYAVLYLVGKAFPLTGWRRRR